MKNKSPSRFSVDEDEDLGPSKTKVKAQMEQLQSLGVKLVGLNKNQLAKFELPDSLLIAVREAQKITANGALRRQYQYIGKLMRDVDTAPIEQVFAEINGDSAAATRRLHEMEIWRDRLMADDSSLTDFITEYPNCDISELRSMVRATIKEAQTLERRNYKKLFQLIRDVVGGKVE